MQMPCHFILPSQLYLLTIIIKRAADRENYSSLCMYTVNQNQEIHSEILWKKQDLFLIVNGLYNVRCVTFWSGFFLLKYFQKLGGCHTKNLRQIVLYTKYAKFSIWAKMNDYQQNKNLDWSYFVGMYSSRVRQVFSIKNYEKQEYALKVLRFWFCWISK